MDDQDVQKYMDFLSPQDLKSCFIEKKVSRNIAAAARDGVIKING